MYWISTKSIKLSLKQLLESTINIENWQPNPFKPSPKVKLTIEYTHSDGKPRYQGIAVIVYREEAEIIKDQIESLKSIYNVLEDTSVAFDFGTIFSFKVRT